MEVTPARIVMIDDQVSFVDAFGLALSLTEDLKLVGRATNAQDGTDLALQHRPDLVVTDYRLPNGQTGTAVADQLRSEGFQSPIIVLTGFLAPQVRREVAGLVDVCAISKDASVQDIVTSMRSVLSGEAETEEVIDLDREAGLTGPELEVLEALNTGAAPNEIAQLLHPVSYTHLTLPTNYSV